VSDHEYDLLLASVPAPLAAGAALRAVSSLSLTLTLGFGSLLTAALVGVALPP
jgi:hypothetical protein